VLEYLVATPIGLKPRFTYSTVGLNKGET
jgi:hypothetical protein